VIYPRWIQNLSRADFLSSVGLYVMRDRLFLVRMRKDLFRLSVVEVESREIELGEETALRSYALNEAIRSFLPHFDPAKEPLYVCLSPDQTIGIELYLPQAAEENLQQVLEYEIERHLPFRREEVYYDFLPMGKKGDKVGILLFAVPKKYLDEVLDVLSALDLKPEGVETTASAISNYLLFCKGGIPGPALVLGGESQSWEMVGLGAKGNGWREEPVLLYTHGLSQADWLKGPGREIFHSCLRESPECYSWGETSDFLHFVEGDSLLSKDLLALGKEKLVGDKEMAHPFFLPAAGAALRGLRESTLPINFIPGTGSEKQGRMLSGLNMFLALFLLIGLLVWGGSYSIKGEMRLRQLQNEIQRLRPSVNKLLLKEDELKKLREELSFLSGMKERKGEILRALDELSRIVPSSSFLSNLRYREGSVELRGSAENASNLVPILERSPLFKEVESNAPSTRRRDGRETFSIKAVLEQPNGRRAQP